MQSMCKACNKIIPVRSLYKRKTDGKEEDLCSLCLSVAESAFKDLLPLEYMSITKRKSKNAI